MSNQMNFLLPPEAAEKHNIPNVFDGSLRGKLQLMLEENSENLIQIDDAEYKLLRDVLLALEIDFKIVIAIPDVSSPSSFLHETNDDLIVSFANLVPQRPDSDESFMDELRSGIDMPESHDEGKEDDYLAPDDVR